MVIQSPYEVWDVSDWDVESDETAGRDEKQWIIQPDEGASWLYKPVTVKNGFRQGEDWSERVSSELATAMSIPCADIQLATRSGQPGSISKNLRPHKWEMQSGSLLLTATDPTYQPGAMNIKGRPGHSLDRIAIALSGAEAPPGAHLPEDLRAFDVFVGYLVLDAWIANRDRHDENWSILLPPTERSRRLLCGSYDHAGGLGFNVPDTDCARRLGQQAGVLSWVERGTAHRFEHDPQAGPTTLVEHAMDAMALTNPDVRDFWMQKLTSVSHDTVVDLLSRVPDLSDPCRNFAIEVLRTNTERLCGAYKLRFG